MATVVPTITQFAPNCGKKMVYFSVTASASDTFTLSAHFSTVEVCSMWRTSATGTAVTGAISSSTTVTIGSGPSAETVYGLAIGVA